MNLSPYILSLQVTALATVLLVIFGLPLAIFFGKSSFPWADNYFHHAEFTPCVAP